MAAAGLPPGKRRLNLVDRGHDRAPVRGGGFVQSRLGESNDALQPRALECRPQQVHR